MFKSDIYIEAHDLKEIATQIVQNVELVGYIDISKVIFLKDRIQFKGDALARCFNLSDHPIQFFTDKEWCIVFYENRVDYMNENQLQILMLHELMHINPIGQKSIDHNVKDFQAVLKIDLDWHKVGAEVPNILDVELTS